MHKGASLVIEISLGQLSPEEYSNKNINELGRVPVMMYHGIHNKKIVKLIILVVMLIEMDIKEPLRLSLMI